MEGIFHKLSFFPSLVCLRSTAATRMKYIECRQNFSFKLPRSFHSRDHKFFQWSLANSAFLRPASRSRYQRKRYLNNIHPVIVEALKHLITHLYFYLLNFVFPPPPSLLTFYFISWHGNRLKLIWYLDDEKSVYVRWGGAVGENQDQDKLDTETEFCSTWLSPPLLFPVKHKTTGTACRIHIYNNQVKLYFNKSKPHLMFVLCTVDEIFHSLAISFKFLVAVDISFVLAGRQ